MLSAFQQFWGRVHPRLSGEGERSGDASVAGCYESARGGFTLVEMMATVVVIAILAGIATKRVREAIYGAQVARAATDVRAIEQDVQDYLAGHGSYPPDLVTIGDSGLMDPWGNPYQYLRISSVGLGGGGGGGGGGQRQDLFGAPLNSDFDLYSMGRDGQSAAGLSAGPSRDDVVRANDGAFSGLAASY